MADERKLAENSTDSRASLRFVIGQLRVEIAGLEDRLIDWRAWVARVIGFDHVVTSKTDGHMRADVNGELQRLIDRVGEVQAERDGLRARVAELEAGAARPAAGG